MSHASPIHYPPRRSVGRTLRVIVRIPVEESGYTGISFDRPKAARLQRSRMLLVPCRNGAIEVRNGGDRSLEVLGRRRHHRASLA